MLTWRRAYSSMWDGWARSIRFSHPQKPWLKPVFVGIYRGNPIVPDFLSGGAKLDLATIHSMGLIDCRIWPQKNMVPSWCPNKTNNKQGTPNRIASKERMKQILEVAETVTMCV